MGEVISLTLAPDFSEDGDFSTAGTDAAEAWERAARPGIGSAGAGETARESFFRVIWDFPSLKWTSARPCFSSNLANCATSESCRDAGGFLMSFFSAGDFRSEERRV